MHPRLGLIERMLALHQSSDTNPGPTHLQFFAAERPSLSLFGQHSALSTQHSAAVWLSSHDDETSPAIGIQKMILLSGTLLTFLVLG